VDAEFIIRVPHGARNVAAIAEQGGYHGQVVWPELGRS
jgi:hypothetical protein